MVMCTAKDRSAERDSPQCASEKQARLEKGAHYLKSLLDDARTDPESEAGAAAVRLMRQFRGNIHGSIELARGPKIGVIDPVLRETHVR
eukprot:COSAG06_NODE_62521_length_264_cov_91.193939_1_plen_88_part_11